MEQEFKRLREKLNLEAQIRAAVQKEQLQSAPSADRPMWMIYGVAVVALLASVGILLMVL